MKLIRRITKSIKEGRDAWIEWRKFELELYEVIVETLGWKTILLTSVASLSCIIAIVIVLLL